MDDIKVIFAEEPITISGQEFIERLRSGEKVFSKMKIIGEGETVSNMEISNIDLSQSYVTGILFKGCAFENVLFESSRVYCEFQMCKFNRVSYVNATISAQFSYCAFFETSFIAASFRKGYIRSCRFRGKCGFYSSYVDGTWSSDNIVDVLQGWDTVFYTMGGATREEVKRASERFKKGFAFCGSGTATFSNGNVLEAQYDGDNYIDFTGYTSDGSEIDGGQYDLEDNSFFDTFESIIRAVLDFMNWKWGAFTVEID